MTPERRKYLIKSSNKEREIRGLIRRCKKALSISKSECNAFNLKPADKKPLEYLEKYIQLKDSKILLQALRHELARLKGLPIDTEAKPIRRKEIYDGVTYNAAYCGRCKLFIGSDKRTSKQKRLEDIIKYCPYCGKRVAWKGWLQ